MDKETIGKRLRELRGFFRTQREVADDIGISPAALSMWERGERVPGDEAKIALARYYNVSVQELFYD